MYGGITSLETKERPETREEKWDGSAFFGGWPRIREEGEVWAAGSSCKSGLWRFKSLKVNSDRAKKRKPKAPRNQEVRHHITVGGKQCGGEDQEGKLEKDDKERRQ